MVMPIFSTQNHRDSNFAPNHIQEEQQTNKMGPKRRQPQDPKKPGRKPRARKKEPVRSPVQLASQLELIEAAHAVLDHNQSSQLRSQMSLILHKPNRLTEMIRNNSSQDSSRRRLSFEKDDGFKYKRGLQQSDRRNGAMERLEREVRQLEEEYDDLDGVNSVVVPKKRQQRPKTAATRGRKPTTQKLLRTENLKKQPQLSSPIRLPKFVTEIPNDFSSDEYVEQVSHERIQLAGPSKRSKPGNRRRSSYYNRGKRLSSIGNGFEGLPHDDVSPSDYHKLLNSDLPEPQRMRQLLVWTMRKRLQEEDQRTSNDDQTVVNIAKVIKDEVLQQLVLGEINVNWYNRGDDNEDIPEITLPNPLNIQNEKNLATFKNKLQDLINEQQQWRTSYQKAIAPLEQSKIKDTDVALDPSTASTYDSTVLEGTLLDDLEKFSHEISSHQVAHEVEAAVDKLYHNSYRLDRALELVGKLQHQQFNPQLSQLLKKYMSKPTNPAPTTKQLLRGLTRIPQD